MQNWSQPNVTLSLDLFETTFNHRAFTGRSGTFFAYEGLGSIYWHMVSKLLLAAQECYQQAVDEGVDTAVIEALAAAYYDIRAGIGFNKSPDVVWRISHRSLFTYADGRWCAPTRDDRTGERRNLDPLGGIGCDIAARCALFCANPAAH